MRPPFSVNSRKTKDSFAHVSEGEVHVRVKLLVDSGTTVNVIDQKLWKCIKINRVKCVSQKSSKELFDFGGKPLTVIGSFQADVSLYNESKHRLIVIQEEAPGILGKDTALKLGLLTPKLSSVNSVNDRKTELMSKFPLCISGFGKLDMHMEPFTFPNDSQYLLSCLVISSLLLAYIITRYFDPLF